MSIERNVEEYLGSRDPTARYSSFDYCFNYFQAANDRDETDALASPERAEESCLQLGFYLASWGMLRASSPLLQRSVRTLETTIQAITEVPRALWNLDVDAYGDDHSLDLVLDSAGRLRRSFAHGASDILVTKVMLGVFGCVPAFDTYFKRGLGASTFGRKSLRKVRDFYLENAETVDSYRVPTLDFLSGRSTGRRYTRAKVIDMNFFIEGSR